MRLTDLLGTDVVDAHHARVGSVADLALVQDGPVRGPYQATLRVAGLIVVERRHVQLMGYERDVRPVVFRGLVARLAGDVWHVPWEDVAGIEPDGVHLRVPSDRLVAHDPMRRRAVR